MFNDFRQFVTCLNVFFLDIQNVDSITSKHYQKLNEQQSESLVSGVREQMQSEFARGLSVLQESTLRIIRDSIRESFTQHFTDISGARYGNRIKYKYYSDCCCFRNLFCKHK